MSAGLAFDEDFHVHSTFSDGVSTLAENVAAARERGLRTVCLADHVRAGTEWVPDFVAAVSHYRSLAGLRVMAGVEAKILDAAGRLDVPPDLFQIDGIDLVLVADHQFPADHGPIHPAAMRAEIEGGRVTAEEAIECLVTAMNRALGAAEHVLLAHPFSLLPKMGLSEEQVPTSLLDDMAKAAARAGAMVEINEKWHCPAPRTVAAMMSAGVHLVPGSDSHDCANIGVYRTVRQTMDAASGTARSGDTFCS